MNKKMFKKYLYLTISIVGLLAVFNVPNYNAERYDKNYLSYTLGTSTSFSSSNTFLNNFYNSLDNKEMYLLENAPFCLSENISSCTNLVSQNIGLITKNEYVSTFDEDNNTFIKNEESLTMTEYGENVYYIDEDGRLALKSKSDQSYAKGAVFINSNVSLLGSGSREDPFVMIIGGDIIITSIEIDGESSMKVPKTGVYNFYYSCSRGAATIKWDNVTHELSYAITSAPVTCSLSFSSSVSDFTISSIKINNVSSSSLPTTGTYDMTSSCKCNNTTCPPSTVIEWDNTTMRLVVKIKNVPMVCALEFSTSTP